MKYIIELSQAFIIAMIIGMPFILYFTLVMKP